MSEHSDLIDALTAGRPLSQAEAEALVDKLAKKAQLAGWRAGFHQADTDALHQALNDGQKSTSDKVDYTVEEGRPDGYPVWRIVRTRGRNVREVTDYRHPTAADIVTSALNHAARHEDL